MAQLPVPGFDNEGFGWVTNLTLADPYYILPSLAGLGFVAVLESGGELGGGAANMSLMKPVMRVAAILSIPLTASFPAVCFL